MASAAATSLRSSAYCAFVTSYLPILYVVATAPQGEAFEAPQLTGLVSAALPDAPTVTQSLVTAETTCSASVATARASVAARRSETERAA